jgi:ATP-dependent Clp protease ATP-binding subunit ClpA
MAVKKENSFKNLKSSLKNRIFGQDSIIEEVVNTININKAGLGDENKPIASFLFTGPTGVGKTELAKELAKFLGIHFERFDMSEYADEYSARNLTGGSAGLVGYKEGGLLTNAINKNPNCVLLLDEIEKADKLVYNTFLQVLDYGTLTDTKGNKADFTSTIIIMTSNLGSHEEVVREVGFGAGTKVHKSSSVVNFFTPEFRNRIDKIMEFNKLTKDVVMNITNKFLDDFSDKLANQDISLSVSTQAKEKLNDFGFDTSMGARSVSRTINNTFKQNISQEILYGSLSDGGEVTIDVDDDGFIFNYESQSTYQKEDNDYDFETAEEASEWARCNPLKSITRTPSGYGYIIK